MNAYTIAPTRLAHDRNEGTIIMASSIEEAVDKYMVLEGVCHDESNGAGEGSVIVVDANGAEWECPVTYEPEIHHLDDDDDEACCPKCGHVFII